MPTNQSEDDLEPVRTLVATAFEVELGRRGDAMDAMNAICTRLGVSLTRWVGAGGWTALLGRALNESSRARGGSGLSLDVLGRLQNSGGGATRSEFEQVLVTVSTVLGRLVGPGMALRAMEQGLADDNMQRLGGSARG